MEDLIRYLIISIAILYTIKKLNSLILHKEYGCNSCSHNKTCNKNSCVSSNIKLSSEDLEKIKTIKLIYKS